jgi:hypothetical protein
LVLVHPQKYLHGLHCPCHYLQVPQQVPQLAEQQQQIHHGELPELHEWVMRLMGLVP